MKIEMVVGVTPAYAQKLIKAGIRSSNRLLRMGATKKGRQAIAEQTGIAEPLIEEWVNRLDLMRVSGVGGRFLELLWQAEIRSVRDLRHRRSNQLRKLLSDFNAEHQVSERVPTQIMVDRWTDEARTLDPIVRN
jgi:thioesterase domain-containing protein